MNLNCNDGIITKGLLVHFDLTNNKSWDGNNEYRITSLNKWKNSTTENLNLIDFGLTQFDVGATNEMWGLKKLESKNDKLSLNRIGYNTIKNPTNRETTGVTATITHDGYDITGVTSGISGNYFDLNGGYLNNFFKLEGYNHELLPSRYRNGITIETILNITENSSGIFLYMGLRSEDKYNPHYDGEFSKDDEPTGVHTSEVNFLESHIEEKKLLDAFIRPEEMMTTTHVEVEQLNNIKNNSIGFYLSKDKKFGYKFIGENGNIISNESDYIHNNTGFTLVTIVFKPEYNIPESENLKCVERRKGDLMFYVNGLLVWNEKDFPEFYFRKINNDVEKQIGVPYNISWGGGSFGLKHSFHYDKQEYIIYENDDLNHIVDNFSVSTDPTGNTKNIFVNTENILNKDGNTNQTLKITTTGNTNQFILFFDKTTTLLSNREYDVSANIRVNNFFNGKGKISIIVDSNETEIYVFDENVFEYPKQMYLDWIELNTKFAIEDNVGKKNVKIGLLFESEESFNISGCTYLNNFVYCGADVLVGDETKKKLTIETNFDDSFIGGIQKLRIYDSAFTQNEIQHNGMYEMNNREDGAFVISRGGRLINNT